MLNILNFYNIDFEREKTFDWAKNKRYDFYISSLSLIIEIMGSQHYKDWAFGEFRQEKENDKLKEHLAKENGIKHYIKIKSDKSNFEYIFKNIKNSDLKKYIDFDKIDINKIKKESYNNNFEKIIKYYNNGNNSNDISKILKFSKSYVCNLLIKANELNLVDYKRNYNSKKVICENKIFNSIEEFKEHYNIQKYSHVGEWLNGNRKIPQKWKDRGLAYYEENEN